MSKLKVVLNRAGVRELLQSDEIGEIVKEKTTQVAINAGAGFEPSFQVSNRAVGRVKAATVRAYRSNMKNNTLLKALRAVK